MRLQTILEGESGFRKVQLVASGAVTFHAGNVPADPPPSISPKPSGHYDFIPDGAGVAKAKAAIERMIADTEVAPETSSPAEDEFSWWEDIPDKAWVVGVGHIFKFEEICYTVEFAHQDIREAVANFFIERYAMRMRDTSCTMEVWLDARRKIKAAREWRDSE